MCTMDAHCHTLFDVGGTCDTPEQLVFEDTRTLCFVIVAFVGKY
jgi:hypothetical protein